MKRTSAEMKMLAKTADALALVLPSVVLIVFLIGFWQVQCTVKQIPAWMLAKPSDIGVALISGFSETLPYLISTYSNILVGFLLAVVIGLALAILLTNVPLLAMAVTPMMVTLACVPMVTLVPLLLVLAGTGSTPKIVTIVVQCFAMVNMNACVGFMNVNPQRLELMQSMKATRYQQFRYCILRDAMPDIFTGIKLASILAMITGVSSEMSGGSGGLGNRISYLVGYSRTSEAFSCILYVAVLGLALYFAISLLEKKLTKGM
ncbi:MAG: transporter permease [Oscillospiraceae bacterium]|nr:transporter permease [Oscillospiraceae bacterium]